VALDKSEGSVKDKLLPPVFLLENRIRGASSQIITQEDLTVQAFVNRKPVLESLFGQEGG
jgi:hypothetical protein